jgi:hypothetical protein
LTIVVGLFSPVGWWGKEGGGKERSNSAGRRLIYPWSGGWDKKRFVLIALIRVEALNPAKNDVFEEVRLSVSSLFHPFFGCWV